MLSTADAEVVRRDRSIPGLGTVLDGESLAARLRPLAPWAGVGPVAVLFIKHKPGRSCRVSYRIEIDGRPVDAYAKAYPASERDEFLDQIGRCAAGAETGPSPGVFVLEDCGVVVRLFPNDSRLPALSRLASPQDQARWIREFLPDQTPAGEHPMVCLRYKPERRYLARLATLHGPAVALKWYTRKGLARGRHRAGHFQSRGALQVPRVLAASESDSVVAMEWLEGRALADALTGESFDSRAVSLTASALAEAHRQSPEALPVRTRAAEAADAAALAEALAFLCPDLAARARRLGEALARRLAGAPAVHKAVHGDFSAKQALVGAGGAGILDFDRAGRGDGALDLGNLIAQTERFELRGEIPRGRTGEVREALLDGYGRAAREPVSPRLGLYTALGLLRRTQYPFQVREPDWPGRTEALLARAEAILVGPS